jgi:Na+/H+-dicarboxylate symporter
MSNNSNNNNKNNQYQHEEEEEAAAPAGCGIFGRYPLITLITFAALGIACGVGLSYWDDDGDAKTKTIKWIGLLGDLFIRALKCLVLPLIFVSVTISVLDMMAIGRAGSVGVKTSKLVLLRSTCHACDPFFWACRVQPSSSYILSLV